MILIIWLS